MPCLLVICKSEAKAEEEREDGICYLYSFVKVFVVSGICPLLWRAAVKTDRTCGEKKRGTTGDKGHSELFVRVVQRNTAVSVGIVQNKRMRFPKHLLEKERKKLEQHSSYLHKESSRWDRVEIIER